MKSFTIKKVVLLLLIALGLEAYAQERVMLKMPPVDRRMELLTSVYEQVDWGWFHSFYGQALPKKLSVAVAEAGGGKTGYGRYTRGDTIAYALVEVRHDTGRVSKAEREQYATLLLHEFSHPFVNYLIDSHSNELRGSGEALFSMVEAKMVSLGYGSWKEVMVEALVRASVIKYRKDHGEQQGAARLVSKELRNGFFWIGQLVDELERYAEQRDRYPTLESYMPQLIAAQDVLVEKIQPLDDSRKPLEVSIGEFTNGDTRVSAELKTITVSFSAPLSVVHGGRGKKVFPRVRSMRYTNGKRSVVLEASLEKDTEYELVLVGEYFTFVGGIGIREYHVNFKTGG